MYYQLLSFLPSEKESSIPIKSLIPCKVSVGLEILKECSSTLTDAKSRSHVCHDIKHKCNTYLYETVDCCDNSRISFTLFLTEGVWSIYGIYITHTSHMFICNNHMTYRYNRCGQ